MKFFKREKQKEQKQKRDGESVWLIDCFQFENVINYGQYFFLIDLSVHYSNPFLEGTSSHKIINEWMKQAHKMSLEEVITGVKAAQLSPEMPLLLICDEGDVSLQAAQRLDEQGYINVFALRGGIVALQQYLE